MPSSFKPRKVMASLSSRFKLRTKTSFCILISMPSPIRYCTSILFVAVLALSTPGDAVVSICLPSSALMHGCKSGTCCCKTNDGSVAACYGQKGGEGNCFSVAGCSRELPPAFHVPQKDDALTSFVFVLQNDIAPQRNTSVVKISCSFEILVDLFHPPQS